MLSENEFFFNSDDIFLIIWVIISQLLQYFGLNKSLFIQSLFISQNFKARILLQLVIIAPEHLSKTTFS